MRSQGCAPKPRALAPGPTRPPRSARPCAPARPAAPGRLLCRNRRASAQGFWLELTQRLRERLLPPLRDESRLRSILHLLFAERDDHLWVTAVADDAWLELAAALG
jgi:site-specific recombinase